jgi:hypothetical protein
MSMSLARRWYFDVEKHGEAIQNGDTMAGWWFGT